MELVRYYYNFTTPRSALKFGREVRTPAMQARLSHPAPDAQGDLSVRPDIRSNINNVRRDRIRWHSYSGNCHEHSNASGGVATLDGGSTGYTMLTAVSGPSARIKC